MSEGVLKTFFSKHGTRATLAYIIVGVTVGVLAYMKDTDKLYKLSLMVVPAYFISRQANGGSNGHLPPDPSSPS